ncbi:serine acetyltransferase [Shewanella algae]|uniref:serine O-acetyltransferase n=1 Tax=Shewanella algae TaxID=38313 RepID=UPI0011833CD2|nr:serine acetyltransferase [Shewanella algae]MBO2653276.1 serine acetyltransferase [Shewanella algae]TVK95904.1 serine acetyltransferase [Shewanella algae]
MLFKMYLIGRFFYLKRIKILSKILYHIQKLIFNSSIPHSTIIGKNSTFAYGGIGVVIHSKAILGDSVMIGQGCTIGGRGKGRGIPEIGNKVYIGPGSRILGGVKIGDNVIVAPNSVVLIDVPANSIIAGVPGKIIKSNIKIDEYL